MKLKPAFSTLMNNGEISDSTIQIIAKHIDERNNKPSQMPIFTIEGKTETPHYFEIVQFDQIDKSIAHFFAVSGAHASKDFYNGLSLAVYTAGYIAYKEGNQVRLNDTQDPVNLGKAYYPRNILITNEEHKEAIYEELLSLEPVKNLLELFSATENEVFGFGKELLISSTSKLLSFCQEILEWALILEIANLSISKAGDFILREGNLRSNNIKQQYLIKLGEYIKAKNLYLVGVSKNSPIKLELNSTFKKIDSYLQDEYKHVYPFKTVNPKWQKLCVWLEVPDDALLQAYPEAKQNKEFHKGNIESITKTSMFAKKDITGGRGFGIFFAARLDYVEKLQNYDWVVADLNIFDVMSNIRENDTARNIDTIKQIFYEITRLTQEHYILGYPYPLVEVNNFIELKSNFNDEITNRIKFYLYKDHRMDNVDIENLFLDTDNRF